jgi:pSer/pThr/pTyr-binding forkhead associated (FHA) protein
MRQPRGILVISFGRMAEHKTVIDVGQTIRVGRTDHADLVIGHDAQMSRVHFEVTWDGKTCTVKDLESATGTLVGGQKVAQAEIPHGSWIRAGETDFTFYIEGHTPGLIPDDTVEMSQYKEIALSSLADEVDKGDLYAIFDGARTPRIPELLRESAQQSRSLFDGVKGKTLDEVAPYLVKLDGTAPVLDWFVMEGWGLRWGIYFTCKLPLNDVRRHFRRFLLVEDDDTGEKFYFKFYDPRVFGAFLPSCAARQRSDFFGDVNAFLFEGKHGELLRVESDEKGASDMLAAS